MGGTITRRLLPLFVAAMCLRPALSHAQVNVLSNHYDDARTGANLSETTLTAANVSVAGFGRLYSYPVDGSVYAQPLYVSGVPINGVPRNVLYVATMNDKVYAFNADSSSPVPLWTRDFTSAPSVTPVPISDIGAPASSIAGNVGIESTPVIDPATRTIYLVARTKENGTYVQKLHALDITTGAERPGSPVTITATATGNAPDAVGGVITFDPRMENQRVGLVLANGVVMIAWASHQDAIPSHGWVVGYNAGTLAQVGAFCVTRDAYLGGIWQSGRAPAVDASGNVYFVTGNATWDGTRNFGDSVLKFSVSTAGIALADYFTPGNWATLNANDADLGATGPMIIPGSNAMVIGGKEGVLYLVNAAGLGHETSDDSQIIQRLSQTTGMLKGGPVYWNSPTVGPLVYYWAQSDALTAFHFNGTRLDALPFATGTAVSPGSPGGSLTLSANGNLSGTGVVWASLSTSQSADTGLVAGIVRAYNAETLQELWNSEQNPGRDRVGTLMKFVPPLVANGKVFQPNYDGAVAVYGLLPPINQPTGNDANVAALASSGIVHVGGAAAQVPVVNRQMTFTYTPVAANDAIVFFVGCRMPGVTGISLSAPGWTVTPISGLVGPNTIFDYISTFGAIVPSATPVTFTVTFSVSGTSDGCSNDGTILLDEFSGNDITGGTTTFDAHNENIPSTSPTCVGAPVTPANNDGAVWYGCYDHVLAATSGYTLGQTDGIGDGTEYKILTGQLGVPQSPGFNTDSSFPGFGLAGVSIRAGSSSATTDLTVTKTHSGNFAQGQIGASYSVTVRNTGTAATTGTVTMTDTLPAGLSATAISGTNWSCTLATLVCTRSDALAAGGSYPVITITVNVAGNAAASVTNTATVSGGGDTNTANNSASDPTTITPTAPATIRRVQSAFNGNESGTANMSVSFPSSNTAGNFLIVAATAARPAGTLSISDTLGNTYVPALTPVTDVAQEVTAHIWYVPIARGGANTVTITPSSARALEIHVSEWSGVSSVSPVDQVSFAMGTGTDLSSGAKTTTANGELIFGFGWVVNNATAGAGFAPLSLINGDLDEYQIQSTAGSIAATFTQASGGWLALMATFFPASGTAGVVVPNVVNQTQAAATTAITNAGLVVGVVTTASSGTVPAGSVISQTPTAGTVVASGSAVNLVVSTGSGSQVSVPAVVNLTQAAATTAITGAGLVVGAVTTASSGTVPAGSVISQSPTAGTLVSPGSAVNLVVSTGSGASGVDALLFSDGAGTRTITGFTTTRAGDLLLAFVGADGPSSGGQTATVSGAALTWTLVRRVNTQLGTSEIWKATAPGVLSNASITSTLASSSYRQSLTVVAFAGASGTGASAGANAASGAPSVSLVTTQPGSLIYGVGNDWQNATARTLGSGQAMAHQWVDSATGDTYWVQNRTAPIASAGTTAQLNDTAPTADRWNFVAVEVITTPGVSVAVPNVVNLTQAAATTAITNAGLVVGTVTTASSATVPSGSVISQTPVAGTSVSTGSAVNLVVSTGTASISVPNVVNLTQAAATTAITNAGLVVGTVTTASSATVPSGSVISQTPVAGTSVASGSAVNLTVSTGALQVSVPGVVNLTQSAATTAITNAGLVVGTVTTASSTTVPSGSVISQSPAAGTMVAAGSSVNLVVSTGPPSAGITVDATVFSDGLGTRTAAVTTAGPNRLLLAFASSDGLATGGQTLTVSGGGLTWTLVRRVNASLGSSEIWRAMAPSTLSNASITLTQSQTNHRQSLTVVAFAGASAVGASNTASAAVGGPTVSVTTTKAGALVYGVGNDYDRAVARTVGSGQTKVHEWVDTTTGDTYWVQARTGSVAAAGTAITLNDTAPTTDRWNFAIVEVVP